MLILLIFTSKTLFGLSALLLMLLLSNNNIGAIGGHLEYVEENGQEKSSGEAMVLLAKEEANVYYHFVPSDERGKQRRRRFAQRSSSLPPAGRHRQSTNGGGGGSSPHINVQIQSPSVQLREEQPSNVGGSRIGIDATTARLGGLHLNREQLSSQLERRYAASRSGASMPTTSGQHTGDINWNRIMLDMFQDPEGMESSRNMWWGSILEHGPNFEPNRGLVQFPDERNARTVERLTDWRGNPLSLPNYRRANQMRPFIRGSPPPRYRSQTGLTVDDSASVAITEPSEQRSLFGRFREALRRRRNRMGQGLQQCIGCAAPGRDDDRDAYEPGAGYVSPTIKTRTNRSNIIVAEAKAYFGAA